METRTTQRPRAAVARLAAICAGIALLTAMAAPVAATHTHGTLDCGSAGTYHVHPASEVDPLPFEAPGPGSGVWLIEDSTQVFKAFSVVAPHFAWARASSSKGLSLVDCTLTSTGPMFSSPWTLEGTFLP